MRVGGEVLPAYGEADTGVSAGVGNWRGGSKRGDVMKIEDCKDHENGKRSLIVTMELTDLDDPEFEATIGTLLNMFF